MKKKLIKLCSTGLIVVLAAILVFAFMPSGISITGEGKLSLQSNVAIATNIPPISEITGKSYAIGDEVIEKRTRNSKTHDLGDNKFSWDGKIGAVHYEDNGWQDIDNIFEPAVAPWNWQMLKAGYHIRVKEDFTSGQIIEFEKQGEAVQFQPMALEWTNDLDQIQQISMPQDVVPVITNPEVDLVGTTSHQGTIRWDNAYGEGIDFEWKCTTTRLVKILQIESLNNLPVPEPFIIAGGNPVLRLNLIFDPPNKNAVDIMVDGEVWDRKAKKQTFRYIEFRKGNEVLWGFMPLIYWDSDPDEDKQQSVATLEKRGNKLYISIRVPYEWLQSATYPVFIDTDVDEQVGTSTDDCLRRLVSSYWSLTHGTLRAGCTSAEYYQQGSGMRFDNITVPKGATIGAAYITIYAYEDGSTTTVNSKVSAEDVDDAPTFADDSAAFDARWANRGTPVDWDGIGTWTAGQPYNSPEIKTVIKEIVDRGSWASGNAIVIFWEDFDNLSSVGARRYGKSYDNSTSDAATIHIEYTEVGPDISNTPATWIIGTVSISTDYWANGSEPSWPLDDGECEFAVTNNSGAAVDITIKATNFTGGVGWTISSSAGENQVVLKGGVSGVANEGAFTVLTTGEQSFINSLPDSNTEYWELMMESATSHTDAVAKESIVTLSATLS